jgi:hypothetical protein
VFIPKDFKPFTMNTYEKHRGEGSSLPILKLSPLLLTSLFAYLTGLPPWFHPAKLMMIAFLGAIHV